MENNKVNISMDALMELMITQARMDAFTRYVARKKEDGDKILYTYEIEAFLGIPAEGSKE